MIHKIYNYKGSDAYICRAFCKKDINKQAKQKSHSPSSYRRYYIGNNISHSINGSINRGTIECTFIDDEVSYESENDINDIAWQGFCKFHDENITNINYLTNASLQDYRTCFSDMRVNDEILIRGSVDE